MIHRTPTRRILREAGRPIIRKAAASQMGVVVLCDERPVDKQILLMSGIQWRTDSKQLPLVDARDRSSIRSVLGSVRDCHIDRGRLLGTLSWARDKRSQVTKAKWLDGHIVAFSISADPLEVIEIKRGQTWEGFKGPATVVSRWVPVVACVLASA